MKKYTSILGLLAISLIGGSYPASATSGTTVTTTTTGIGANTAPLARGVINFDALDTDRNGVLSGTELSVSEDFRGEDFSDIDTNDDGSVDGAELSNWARTNGKGNAVSSSRGNAYVPLGTVGVPLEPLVPLQPVRK